MLSDFELVKAVGRGAFGAVFLYKRKSNNQNVVIKKIIVEHSENSQDECKTTENEVKLQSLFKHPNILEYYDSFVEDNTVFIVMEYAPGGTLYDYIQSKKKKNIYLQEADILHLFCQLSAGLQNIHERNILHRDLKSHNVMLDRTQRIVKIGDFGISKILESKSKAHTVVGTPCYLSPELCREKPYNQKSDIWALGCILYEMLALHRAFEAESLPALINKIMRGKIEPISTRYSTEIRELVQSMINVTPEKRPNINEVISNPLVFPILFKLYCDLGRVQGVQKKSSVE